MATIARDAFDDPSVLGIIRDVNVMKYITVASLVVLVYDWFLTVDEEVLLLWPAKWGIPKILFIFNRYVAFADPIILIYVLMVGNSNSTCVAAFRTLVAFNTFGIVAAQIILMMRTYAVWGRERRVTILLIILCLITVAVNICVPILYLSGVANLKTDSSKRGCQLQFENRVVYADFINILVLELVMVILLVVKALQHGDLSRSTLMKSMLTDGVMYFVFILGTSIFNLICIIAGPPGVQNMLIIVQRVFHSIFCTRVLLHIRAASLSHTVYLSSNAVSGLPHGDGDRPGLRCSGTNVDAETLQLVSPRTSSHSIRPRSVPFICKVLRSSMVQDGGWGRGHGFSGPPNARRAETLEENTVTTQESTKSLTRC